MAANRIQRTPPDASTMTCRARALIRCTASFICSCDMLSSMMMSAPLQPSASSHLPATRSPLRSSSYGESLRERRARPPAMPPAPLIWLSLIMTASYRPNRWLWPPPTRTAYFSSSRWPGVVLRVSTRRVGKAVERVHKSARLRRDAGQPLQQIQRQAFARQDAMCASFHLRNDVPFATGLTIGQQAAGRQASDPRLRTRASRSACRQATPVSFI